MTADDTVQARELLAAGWPALPHPAARELLLTAVDHGWSAALNHGVDSGGAAFVTVRALRGDHEVRVTWHTRDAGTYRLFSAILRTDRRNWHDVTLAKARQHLEVFGGEQDE